MLNLLEKAVLMFSGHYVRAGILNKIQHFYMWIQLNFMGIPECAALKSHLQAEYKAVYTIQCHKMDEIWFT
jgi:hypothetical protein